MSNTTWSETCAPFMSLLPEEWSARIKELQPPMDDVDCFKLKHLRSLYAILVQYLRSRGVCFREEHVTPELLSTFTNTGVTLATGCEPVSLPEEYAGLARLASNVVTLKTLATEPLEE